MIRHPQGAKTRSGFKVRTAAMIGVAVIGLLLAGSMSALAMKSRNMALDLVYRVSKGNQTLGRIEVKLNQDRKSHQVVALTRPTGIGKLLGAEISEAFRYSPTDGGWHALEYREENSRDRGNATRMTFDHGNKLIARTPEATTHFPSESLVEPQGFPLAVFLLRDHELVVRDILTPTRRGIRKYRYSRMGEENLVVEGQSYDTFKWKKQRPDRTDRGFYIWSEKRTQIPIRIDKFKKKVTVTIELMPLQAGL